MSANRKPKSGIFLILALIFFSAPPVHCAPASAISKNSTLNTDSGSVKTSGKIEKILQRSHLLYSLSGLADIKIQSPKIKKKFKAAILLNGGETTRIDGLSPFGSPVFHLLYMRNNLLIHFPSSGTLYLDYVETEGLFHLLDFPSIGYNLMELVSGFLLNKSTTGEVILKGTPGEEEFLLSMASRNGGESCEVKLDSSLLPQKAFISRKGGRDTSIVYSDYKPLNNGFLFPFHSLFQISREEISIEFFFKSMDINKEFSRKSFRIPVNPDPVFINREDLPDQLR